MISKLPLIFVLAISGLALFTDHFWEPVQTRNAALRYWQAFSELRDSAEDHAVAESLERVAAGNVPWDDVLAPVVEKNTFAIEIMQRATKLPECDWGLDYELGPRAPIAYVPKARVLARLNTLYGIRAEARGETQTAIDAWMAGIQFSEHVTHGGSLIFSLVAAKSLIANFHALTYSVQHGANRLSAEQRKQVAQKIQSLPETGFDWGQALAYEEIPLDVVVKQMKSVKNPAEYYRQLTGKPSNVDFSAPSATDIVAFHKLMSAAQEALRESPEVAEARLPLLQEQVQKLHPFYRQVTPSLTRINDARKEVFQARQELLSALTEK
jgi:hypothetical protein